MQKIAAFIVKKRKLLLVVMLALAVVCRCQSRTRGKAFGTKNIGRNGWD